MSGLGCVIGYVPTGALELHGGRGQEALDFACAGWAYLFFRSAEALDFFKLMAAVLAAVFV